MFIDLANETIMHINVLHLCMILVVLSKGNGCLVIKAKGDGRLDGIKHLRQEAAKPQDLLCAMGCCDVLALSGGHRDNLLSLKRP